MYWHLVQSFLVELSSSIYQQTLKTNRTFIDPFGPVPSGKFKNALNSNDFLLICQMFVIHCCLLSLYWRFLFVHGTTFASVISSICLFFQIWFPNKLLTSLTSCCQFRAHSAPLFLHYFTPITYFIRSLCFEKYL